MQYLISCKATLSLINLFWSKPVFQVSLFYYFISTLKSCKWIIILTPQQKKNILYLPLGDIFSVNDYRAKKGMSCELWNSTLDCELGLRSVFKDRLTVAQEDLYSDSQVLNLNVKENTMFIYMWVKDMSAWQKLF